MNDIIAEFEGFVAQAYPDPLTGKEPWTYGYGSTTKADGTPVKCGDFIEKEPAKALVRDWLIKNAAPVISTIPYRLTENQRQALESLIYNIGAPAFKKSKLYTAICKKDYYNIYKEWDWGVKQLKGLAKRRARELDYFMRDL